MQALLEKLIKEGIEQNIFPAAVAAVGVKNKTLAMYASGHIYLPNGPSTDEHTLFDMASCSKIMSTTMLSLLALEQGDITLEDSISRFFEVPLDKENITVRNLLTHTSGIAPHLLLQNLTSDPKNVFDVILSLPLAGERGKPMYSCLGFILLGKILEKVYQKPLDVLSKEKVFRPLNMLNSGYLPKGDNIAATELDPLTGKAIQGVVHDENARFMGGVAGNAGVFSNIKDMDIFAHMLAQDGQGLLSPISMLNARRNYTQGFDEHRGLGFHVGGLAGSFFGDLLPYDSFGHTGFTGTSVVVDPNSGFYCVLLTNRVHPSRENVKHLRFRRKIHNVMYAEFYKNRA
ncbi:MAG: serine hydrolase domain-containing protein [Eubacteriales bacterium]|nr:serine hydrolase domain-containing protein [Eubacteriales bacterium]